MAGSILWMAVMSHLKPHLTLDMQFASVGKWGSRKILTSSTVEEINLILQKGYVTALLGEKMDKTSDLDAENFRYLLGLIFDNSETRSLTTAFYDDATSYSDYGLELLALTNSFAENRFSHPAPYCFEYPVEKAYLLPSARKMMPSLLPPLQRLDPKQFTHHPDFDTELQKLSLESQTEYRAKTLPRFMTSKYSMAGYNWIGTPTEKPVPLIPDEENPEKPYLDRDMERASITEKRFLSWGLGRRTWVKNPARYVPIFCWLSMLVTISLGTLRSQCKYLCGYGLGKRPFVCGKADCMDDPATGCFHRQHSLDLGHRPSASAPTTVAPTYASPSAAFRLPLVLIALRSILRGNPTMYNGQSCWTYTHVLDPNSTPLILRDESGTKPGYFYHLSCGQGRSSQVLVNFCYSMMNLEFWLTDSGIPYDVDRSCNAIIINANKLRSSHVAAFEATALPIFAAVCNDHPGMGNYFCPEVNDVFENCKDTASFEEQRKQGLGMLKFYARLAEKIGNQMNDSHEYVLYGKFGALSGYTLDHLLRPVRTENVSQRQYSQRYKAELRKSLKLRLAHERHLLLAQPTAESRASHEAYELAARSFHNLGGCIIPSLVFGHRIYPVSDMNLCSSCDSMDCSFNQKALEQLPEIMATVSDNDWANLGSLELPTVLDFSDPREAKFSWTKIETHLYLRPDSQLSPTSAWAPSRTQAEFNRYTIRRILNNPPTPAPLSSYRYSLRDLTRLLCLSSTPTPVVFDWRKLLTMIPLDSDPDAIVDIASYPDTYPEIHGTCYKLPCGDQYLTVVDASSPVSTSLFFPYTDSLWTAPENLDDIYSNQRLSPEEMIEDGQPVAYVGNMSLRYTGSRYTP